MKLKKFEKKLALNKKTIVNLDTNQMSKVNGGYCYTFPKSGCVITNFTNCVTVCDPVGATC